jgi:serine phosphatase RsbU (regulator of sigma subunit)
LPFVFPLKYFIAMKQLKDRLPKQVDVALEKWARAAEAWAARVRLIFALTFAASAGWMWSHPSNAKYVYLLLTSAWMVAMAVGAMMKRSSEASVTAMTMIDLTVVHLGLVAFVWQGLFPGLGAGVYLCYFPVLAVAANRYRATLVVKAGLYAGIGYAAISLWGASSPWFRLAMLFTTTAVLAIGSRKPKDLIVNITSRAVEEAYELGQKQKELDLIPQIHQLFLPPPIVDLPEIWSSAKHGAGTETNGDYFHIFDTPRGPLVAVGDLGGEGFKAISEVAELHQQMARIIGREPSLPKILEELNRFAWEKYQGRRQFTCVLTRWEGDEMRYANAGHLPLIHMSKPQGAQIIGHKQLPVTCEAVGKQAEADFTELVVPFPARDQLVIYTDGVFAKLTSDHAKGVAEVEALAEKFGGAEVTTLCHRIFDCAQPGMEPNKDDSTVVVIRRQPAAVPAATESKAAG